MTDPRPNRLMLRLKEPTRERLMILAREAGVAPLDWIRQAIERSWRERVPGRQPRSAAACLDDVVSTPWRDDELYDGFVNRRDS